MAETARHIITNGEARMRTIEQRLLNVSGYSNYREVLIDSTDTKIALSIYETKRQKPCVIFLPGTMTHPLFYDEFLSRVAENGFNVIGIHFISHGKSPRDKKVFTFDDMIQNVLDTMKFVKKHYNNKIALLGSSQGGILSLAVAGRDSRIKVAFAHNVVLSSLKDTIVITRFPLYLKPFYKVVPLLMNLVARFFPRWQIPITAYLDFDRITKSEEIKRQFYSDPIGLVSYPLHFLATLFSVNLDCITDGSIKCPVVVIASKGDLLFPFDYCAKVFGLIAAKKKEMVVFEEPYHLIFNECIDEIIDPIVNKLGEYLYRAVP